MPSARYVHPEFGYFCPTPRFRRGLRVALACMVLGGIGVSLLRAGPGFSSAHSPASGSTAMMARVELDRSASGPGIPGRRAWTAAGTEPEPQDVRGQHLGLSRRQVCRRERAQAADSPRADQSSGDCRNSTRARLCTGGRCGRTRLRARGRWPKGRLLAVQARAIRASRAGGRIGRRYDRAVPAAGRCAQEAAEDGT